jgi:hypothetical protein
MADATFELAGRADEPKMIAAYLDIAAAYVRCAEAAERGHAERLAQKAARPSRRRKPPISTRTAYA